MSELAHIPLNQLVRGDNPRRRFDPHKMAELEDGIRAAGQVLQSITVRRLSDGMFQIIAGERRSRAARSVLGDDYAIPANILDATDDEAAVMAMIENTHRESMSPVEEAERAARLLNEFKGDKEETAKRLGWKVPHLESRLGLMNATEAVREALLEQTITLGHAEVIAAAPKSKQDTILKGVLEAPTRPTVAELKMMLAQVARPLDKACFDTTDCQQCPQNSSRQAQMFSESIGAGSCTGPECYTAKTETALKAKRESLLENFQRVEIVRPGDNFRVISLKVEGPEGVGEEQSKACQQCSNYGAAIATSPDKMGRVYEGMCFDTACNSRMVAKQMRAAAGPAQGTQTAQTGNSKTASPQKGKVDKANTKSANSTLSSAVIEFRKKLWRKAYAAEMVATPERSLVTLLALAATRNAGKIDAGSVKQAIVQAIPQQTDESALGSNMADVAAALAGQSRERLAALVIQLAGAASTDLEIHQVEQMLTNFGVDLKAHFEVNAEYLALLTKTEIEAVAKEIGLDKPHGDKFKSLFSQKKDELIKALLQTQGFNFRIVPRALQLGTPERA